MASSPTRDSAVSPCFRGCLAFLHRHFPSQSPPSPPLQSISLKSTATLTQRSLHTPQTPAPKCCTFQGTVAPVQGVYSCGKDCLILIPFRLPQSSCFTLSIKCFSSDSDSCPNVGIGPALQFPHLPRTGPVLLTLVFFPQFLPHTEFCVVLCVLFHWSGTSVCFQLVFCMHFCLKVYS